MASVQFPFVLSKLWFDIYSIHIIFLSYSFVITFLISYYFRFHIYLYYNSICVGKLGHKWVYSTRKLCQTSILMNLICHQIIWRIQCIVNQIYGLGLYTNLCFSSVIKTLWNLTLCVSIALVYFFLFYTSSFFFFLCMPYVNFSWVLVLLSTHYYGQLSFFSNRESC